MELSIGPRPAVKKSAKPLHYRFAKKQRHRLNAVIASSSLIDDRPVFGASEFDWTQPLTDEWESIRDEALAIYEHRDAIPPLREISPDHRRIMRDNSWRSFFLIGYGHRQEENIARAPRTAELVSRIPGLNSAFFSILAPGARIVPHRGVTKAFITAHLGIKVPRDRESCWLRVGNERLSWREGEWTVFDDTYEHEVHNDTDETRIVLLCQVARPLKAPGSWVAAATLGYVRRSHFVQDAKNNLADWESVFARAERGEI
ncbi:aspartyl/asparaginyl beta-hydroxylase domain-containing protein [Erythrobacter rubeus]|uniref:Aspartyl/asparaginyl beta-hydroxylase domain-containing protein n=1 Tax=Erythrobacter rubeus TaxID=2760803 RepID=A0ABR8KMP6_9SPHN|nr:aspartyl/asparaginyl beta-hydroxylase domain-containing protein [Erythrobacter rubeus]MBD2841832.1 aspartyl/asparaginyl beta-hydroxylase domain-containing protein [Erythrobacter rubeus]